MDLSHFLLPDANYADALELALRYSRDFLVDVSYGRALALFALGRHEEADTALGEAVDRSPLVAEYLARA